MILFGIVVSPRGPEAKSHQIQYEHGSFQICAKEWFLEALTSIYILQNITFTHNIRIRVLVQTLVSSELDTQIMSTNSNTKDPNTSR